MEENVTNSVWGEPVNTPAIPEIKDTPIDTPPVSDSPIAEETHINLEDTPIDVPSNDVVDNPVNDEPPVPQVTEKIVEKIIEKYPEFENEDAKALFEAFQKGDEDNIYNYLNEKRKNFSVMSDYDVVREGLAKANPKWTEKDIQLELKSKYGGLTEKKDLSTIDQAEYPEEYEKAVAFNERIDAQEMLLARDARDFRISLEEQKKNIQLPKIEQVSTTTTSEPTAEEIAEINRQWETLVINEIPKISDLKFNVNGEEVQYKITDEEKVSLTEKMKKFSAVDYLTERGWFDENGNPNVLKITEDVYQLENRDKMFSSVATKTKNATTKSVVAEIKNVDLSRNGLPPETKKVDAGEAVWNY